VPGMSSLPARLSDLAQLLEAGKAQPVRVRIRNVGTIEGALNTVSPEHLSILEEPSGRLTQVPVEQVIGLDVARHHPLVVGVSIGVAVAFIALGLGIHALGLPLVFIYLGIGAAALVVLPPLRRVARRLRRWESLYRDDAA
jgi:hypothetical protein